MAVLGHSLEKADFKHLWKSSSAQVVSKSLPLNKSPTTSKNPATSKSPTTSKSPAHKCSKESKFGSRDKKKQSIKSGEKKGSKRSSKLESKSPQEETKEQGVINKSNKSILEAWADINTAKHEDTPTTNIKPFATLIELEGPKTATSTVLSSILNNKTWQPSHASHMTYESADNSSDES